MLIHNFANRMSDSTYELQMNPYIYVYFKV